MRAVGWMSGVFMAAIALPAFAADTTAQFPQLPMAQLPAQQAQQAQDEGETPGNEPDTLFGNWWGVKPWLSQRGIDVTAGYLSESAWDVAGGEETGGTYADQFKLIFDIDWDKLAGLPGFSTHVAFAHRDGANTSGLFVGDHLFQAQEIFGGTDAVAVHLVYLYLEQKLWGGKVDIKGGRLPVEHDFGTLPIGCDFMALAVCADWSLGINLGWTVWPRATWGGMMQVQLAQDWTLKAGVYQVDEHTGGISGFEWGTQNTLGAIMPVELDWTPKLGPQGLPGIYKIGAYYDTSDFNDWYLARNGLPQPLTNAPAAQDQRAGFYALAQQTVWHPQWAPDNDGLILFAGYVYNSPKTSTFENYFFTGLIDKAPFPSRPNDRAGLSFTYASVSPDLTKVQRLQKALGQSLTMGSPGVQTDEMILEANYKFSLYRGIGFMPDIQYIIHPNATTAIDDALVLGFQVSATF